MTIHWNLDVLSMFVRFEMEVNVCETIRRTFKSDFCFSYENSFAYVSVRIYFKCTHSKGRVLYTAKIQDEQTELDVQKRRRWHNDTSR